MVRRCLVHKQPEARSQRTRPPALVGLGSYQTAWTLLQKLRTAMVRPGRDRLRGSVEVDQTYVGGMEHGVRGRGAETKFIVVIVIEVLSPKGFGRVRMQRVEDVSGVSLVPFVCAAVESGSGVHTDGWKGYNGLSELGYSHRLTNISSSGDPAHVSMPGGASRCGATQALVARHTPRVGYSGASGCLSQRIRLPIQPSPLPPGFALPPTTATCCRHPANSV